MVESPAVLVIALRWIHAVAAALWVGGGILLLVLRHALANDPRPIMSQALLGRAAGRTLRLGVGVFIITGTLLAAIRLSEPGLGGLYVGTLAVKVGVALVMFWLAVPRRRARSATPADRPPAPLLRQRTTLIVALGLLVYFLSLSLDMIVEGALRGVG